MNQVKKSLGRLLDYDENANEADFIVSAENGDRDNDRVDQESIDWREFDVNPALTLSHNTEDIGLGSWLPETRRIVSVIDPKTGETVKATLMRARFNMNTAKGRELALSVKDGFMKGASISFLPDDDGSQKNEIGGTDYQGPVTTEVAVCLVPANQSASRSVEMVLKSYGSQGATRRAAMLCKSLKRSKDMNKSVQHRVFPTEREAQAFKDSLRRQGVRATVQILGNATTAHEAEGNRRVVEWEEEDLGDDDKSKTHKRKSMSIKLWRNKSDATRIRILRKDLITFSQIDEAKRRAVKDAPSAESQVDDEPAAEGNYDNEGVGTTGNVPPEVNLELMGDTSKVDGDEDWVEESMDEPEIVEEKESKDMGDRGQDCPKCGGSWAAVQVNETTGERLCKRCGYKERGAPGGIKGKTEDYADSTANRAQEMDLDSADEMMALDAAMEEEQVPQAMRGAVKALALKKLKAMGDRKQDCPQCGGSWAAIKVNPSTGERTCPRCNHKEPGTPGIKSKAMGDRGQDCPQCGGSWAAVKLDSSTGERICPRCKHKERGDKFIKNYESKSMGDRGQDCPKCGGSWAAIKVNEQTGERLCKRCGNKEMASPGPVKSKSKNKADDATDDKDCGDMPGYKYLKAAIDHLQTNMKSIEHKDVLAAAQKALAALTGGMSKAYGKDAYPGDQQEVIEGETESEDTLMSKEQTPVEVEGVWTIYDPTTDEYVGEFASEEEASRGITDMAKPPEQEQMSKAGENFKPGDKVTISYGPYAGSDATVVQGGTDTQQITVEVGYKKERIKLPANEARRSKSWKRTKANRHLIVKGLNKAQKSTIGDAVEFMEGCSESKDMPKHLKSGHKHHALSLKGILESKQDDMEPQMSKEAEEEMTLALQKVLQKQEEFDKGMKRKFGQQWEKVGQENGNRLQWDN